MKPRAPQREPGRGLACPEPNAVFMDGCKRQTFLALPPDDNVVTPASEFWPTCLSIATWLRTSQHPGEGQSGARSRSTHI